MSSFVTYACKAVVFVLGVYFIATGWAIAGLAVAAIGLVALVDGDQD